MNTKRICPGCRRPLAEDAPQGLCPECLVKAGLGTGVSIGEETEPARTHFVAPLAEELAGRFPQLEILGLIGQGGMGAVYKARQKQLDRIVALKILPPGIGGDAAFAERFAREAKALAKLDHPGIVTIHEFGQAGGIYFFVMEFVDGVNLRQLLQTGRVSPREALAIVPQICDALQFAHDQGIVHRDIKPENILLDRRGRVKVADFGLAKLVGAGGEPAAEGATAPGSVALTEAGKIIGTPNYIAPEQREHPGEVDHRADIYALGVVFYQMLTGELPGKPIAPPSSRAGGLRIDVRLDEIVLRALEENPERRYAQASQVKTAVETVAGSAPVTQPAARSPMVRFFENLMGSSFTSPAAVTTLNLSALGFLGFLSALGAIPLPAMHRFYRFAGFFGWFGLISIAFILEYAARRKAAKTLPATGAAAGSQTVAAPTQKTFAWFLVLGGCLAALVTITAGVIVAALTGPLGIPQFAAIALAAGWSALVAITVGWLIAYRRGGQVKPQPAHLVLGLCLAVLLAIVGGGIVVFLERGPGKQRVAAIEAAQARPGNRSGQVAVEDLDAKIAQLSKKGTTTAEVIRVLGEPEKYVWGNETFQKGRLPDTFLLVYPRGLSVLIANGTVMELRCQSPGPGFSWHGKLRLGSSLDEVLEAVGPPSGTVVGKAMPQMFSPGVLYKDIDGKKGNCYYGRPDQNVRFFFLDNWVSALYLTLEEEEGFTTVRPLPAVEPFQDVRFKDMSALNLSATPELPATLSFNQKTVWPASMPAGISPAQLLSNAMNPGLGLRQLHQEGWTGKGVNVAIIDQPLYQDHPEFAGKIAAYYDVGCKAESSMHGPAVASLLVGTQCGAAPESRLYYVAAPSWKADTAYYAKALDWIVEQNAQLPPGNKIRVVSVSAAPSGPGSPFKTNTEMWDPACARAEKAGILVLDCTVHHGFIGPCYYDAADPENVSKCKPGFPSRPGAGARSGCLLAPCSRRTTAEEPEQAQGEFGYQYWG